MPIGVAILDSGVSTAHPHVFGVRAGRCFVPGFEPTDYRDALGHGTAVAGAICEKTAAVELWIARVFGTRLTTTLPVLLEALDWCLEQPVALINLSLGTRNEAHRAPFEDRVERAARRGIRIVAAGGALPGDLPGVVSVRRDDQVPRLTRTPDFAACGFPRPIPGLPQHVNLSGVSFAVANVTGCLAAELAERAGD